jgi:hypothetical protein
MLNGIEQAQIAKLKRKNIMFASQYFRHFPKEIA